MVNLNTLEGKVDLTESLPDQKEKISEKVLYYLEVQTDYLHFDTPVFSVHSQ